MNTILASLPLIGMPGIWEWLLIAAAIMLFFGATKLPKLGKGLGEGIRNFKTGIKGELEENKALITAGDDAESSAAISTTATE